jgi:hypothetical protein
VHHRIKAYRCVDKASLATGLDPRWSNTLRPPFLRAESLIVLDVMKRKFQTLQLSEAQDTILLS